MSERGGLKGVCTSLYATAGAGMRVGDPEVAGWRRGQSRAIDFERGGLGGRGAKPYSAECDGLHVVLLPEGLSFLWWQEPPPLD